MRWMIVTAGLFTCGLLSAAEPLRADEVDPTIPPAAQVAQPPDTPVSRAASTIQVNPFEVTGGKLPDWLGRSFQRSLQSELEGLAGVRPIPADASTQSAQADYVLNGRCVGDDLKLEVSVAVVHQPSETVIHNVKVTGQPTDLLQIKTALVEQVRMLFESQASTPAPPLAPRAAANTPSPAVSQQHPVAGAQYAGSDLEWALENPDRFSEELNEYRRRSNRDSSRWYPAYGVYGWGYPYIIIPGPIQRQHRHGGPGIQIRGQYRSDKWDIQFSN